ncbi:EAL domain-containing protein [Ideonella paludis]|uniref:EAL domain-containing protein n=1 Tax=Ideonella paludis TaxID=1233411 RepID=A0ABS5E0A1_9BURK|nr:LapD/MoxY N-terminal periplasmic domain-containing protein [Ideonella paludis]MBQ0936830.1 EAL domain-containing protein [Ideonella paludis]
MSLIRQVWLLLVLTLSLAFVGALGITVQSARGYLEGQLGLKNNDVAQSLALTLSQQRSDATAMELMIASQFDTGNYELISLRSPTGAVLVERRAQRATTAAPDWFVRWLGVEPNAGLALVSDGWKQIGRVEVRSQSSFVNDQLWQGTLRTLAVLSLLAVGAGAVATLGVRRIRAPLDQAVQQADAITERRFVTVSEPSVPELRNVTRAMNAMVARLKSMFDEQAAQVEQLRRQAHCDPLTGLSNRAYFMGRLRVLLGSEDGSAAGALILMRFVDLQGLNRRLGHPATDRLLQEAASAVLESVRRTGGGEVGRLNGSDFAMVVPDVESLRDPALDVSARLRSLLKTHEGDINIVIGAVRWWHGAPISSLLAAADQALAKAEARGPFAVEMDDAGEGLILGEDTWRQHLQQALLERRGELVEFALVNAMGAVVHQECPLRLRLEPEGPLVPAAQWLPMARRTEMTARIDEMAVELALKAIAMDGRARAVNLSPGSLRDSSFIYRLRDLVRAAPSQAPGLWLEVAEAGALTHLEEVRELVEHLRPSGARVGLEHAGERLSESRALLEAGLDFIKLDASTTEGLASDRARAQHIEGMTRMLHGIGLSVFAEGVIDTLDAQVLWECGVDGITGPVVQHLLPSAR